MAQAYGSIDFDDLFLSISTLTLSQNFYFAKENCDPRGIL